MKPVAASIFAVLLFVPALASAHTLKVSGDIGVLMHIDPNDDPVATEPAEIYFWITNKASSATCGCTLTILDGSSTIYASPLVGAATSTPFVFPHAGVYDLVVASASSSLPAFSLAFEQRVELPPKQNSGSSSTFWLYVVGGLILIAATAAGIVMNRKR